MALAIKYRSNSSRDLTPDEVDTNFRTLAEAYDALVGSGGTAPTTTAITSIEPSQAKPGDTIIITGTGFTGAQDVLFTSLTVGVNKFSVLSSTQITATVPAVSAGGYQVQVKGANATSTARAFIVQAAAANVMPVASITQPANITLPTSQVVLAGEGTDADGTIDPNGYTWRQANGPVSVVGLPATTQNVAVSGLSTAGTYQFGFKVKDDKGASSVEKFVSVVVSAAAATGSKIFWGQIDNSIGTPGGSNGAAGDPVYLVQALNKLGNPANVEVHNYGHPGETLRVMRDTYLPGILAEIDAAIASGKYSKFVFTIHGPENDFTTQNGATLPTVDSVVAVTADICTKLRARAVAGNAPISITVNPSINRLPGGTTPVNFDDLRIEYNTTVGNIYTNFADRFVNPKNQLTAYGSGYPGGRPFPNAFASDGTHPTPYITNIMGAELAQTFKADFNVATISPAYVQNIDYSAPPAEIDPESLPWVNVQFSGSGISQPSDFSRVTQSVGDSGNFTTAANGLLRGRAASGQVFIQDIEFTLGNASLEHVFGPTSVNANSDGTIANRAYPKPANGGVTRAWFFNNEIQPSIAGAVVSNDRYMWRIRTDKLLLFQNGNEIAYSPRLAGDTEELHPAIVFGNLNPGDFFGVRQRGVNLVAV